MAKSKKNIKDIQIDSTKEDKPFADRRTAEYELGKINQMIREPAALSRVAAILKKQDSEDEVLKLVTKRKQELLRKFKPKIGQKRYRHPKSIPQVYSKTSNLSPLKFKKNGPVQISSAFASNTISQAHTHVNCPALIIGQQQSSDYRQYLWRNSGTTAAAFWPLSSAPQLPDESPTLGWVGETGANFWAEARMIRRCLGQSASLGIAGVLQFTLPAPSCDSMFYWGARGLLRAPTPWLIDARFGNIWADWVVRVDPLGGTWPHSLWGPFSEVMDAGIFFDAASDPTDPKVGDTVFEGEFAVAAGVSPRIYIGVSLYLSAWIGEVSTIAFGGIGDFFEIQRGITYIGTTV